jgi:uncharacterized protein (TIGR02001 family)
MAQVAGQVSIQNDYRVRGYSVSDGRPVAILDLSFDHPSGVYLNGTAVLAPPEDGWSALPALIGAFGYARRLSPLVSADAGVTRSEYFRTKDGAGAGYTELYAGVTTRHLAAHLYYSPDYFRSGASTIYAEADGVIEPIDRLRLNAHVGVLNYVRWPGSGAPPPTQVDWRVGVSRQFGAISLSGAVTGGWPGQDYYGGEPHSKTGVVVGAGWSF